MAVPFDQFILASIMINAIMMGVTDFEHIEDDPNASDYCCAAWPNDLNRKPETGFIAAKTGGVRTAS